MQPSLYIFSPFCTLLMWSSFLWHLLAISPQPSSGRWVTSQINQIWPSYNHFPTPELTHPWLLSLQVIMPLLYHIYSLPLTTLVNFPPTARMLNGRKHFAIIMTRCSDPELEVPHPENIHSSWHLHPPSSCFISFQRYLIKKHIWASK